MDKHGAPKVMYERIANNQWILSDVSDDREVKDKTLYLYTNKGFTNIMYDEDKTLSKKANFRFQIA
jgi:hypothetical protein